MDDLSAENIRAGLRGTRYAQVEVHTSLGSTQTFLMEHGGPDGRVVVADLQSAGRGRAGRTWEAPPGVGVHMSVLERGTPSNAAPLRSLHAGVAVCRAIERLCGLAPRLKWPNDVQIAGRKVCGILGELAPSGEWLVLGIGVNVHQSPDELPPGAEATSLAVEGASVRRDDLIVGILRELETSGVSLDEYRMRCATVGARVRVELADGALEGTATSVRDDGALLVDGRAVLAGDVVHLRPRG